MTILEKIDSVLKLFEAPAGPRGYDTGGQPSLGVNPKGHPQGQPPEYKSDTSTTNILQRRGRRKKWRGMKEPKIKKMSAADMEPTGISMAPDMRVSL
jgi:hypothetical protein